MKSKKVIANNVKEYSKDLKENTISIIEQAIIDLIDDIKYEKLEKRFKDFDFEVVRVLVPEDILSDASIKITVSISIQHETRDNTGEYKEDALELRQTLVEELKEFTLPTGRNNVFEYYTRIVA